jgi:hypothetical protein
MAARGATRAAGSHSVDRIVRIIFFSFWTRHFYNPKKIKE